MKLKVYCGSKKGIVLTDNDFVGRGGQASVYRKQSLAFKIYHDPMHMIPEAKIRELSMLRADNVMKPLDVVYDRNSRAIGYVMNYCQHGTPLCRLFTKAFKKRHQITPRKTMMLVRKIQETVASIHRDNCLIVDLNEMNVLVNGGFDSPVFIDSDSYQTPGFPATAVMESVCDPLARNLQFNEASDWYAWGIICFTLYIGIHPFKGTHPGYAKKEWLQRMQDNASVLDDGVTLPAACEDMSVIPSPHMDWFRAVFQEGKRFIPPFADGDQVLVAAGAVRVVEHKDGFLIDCKLDLGEPILDIQSRFGVFYCMTESGIYRGPNRIRDFSSQPGDRLLLVNDKPYVLSVDRSTRSFSVSDGVRSVSGMAEQVFMREQRVYTVLADRLLEQQIFEANDRLHMSARHLTSCIASQAQAFEGVLIQRAVENCIVMIPYAKNRLYKQVVPELEPYRIVSARSEGRFMIAIGERDGRYDQLVFVFDREFSGYQLRVDEDVEIHDINFCVLDKGVCVQATSEQNLELFVSLGTVKKVPDAPFGTNCPMTSDNNALHVVDESRVLRISMNKNPIPTGGGK